MGTPQIWSPEKAYKYISENKTIILPKDALITRNFSWNEFLQDYKDSFGGYSRIRQFPSQQQLRNVYNYSISLFMLPDAIVDSFKVREKYEK